MKATLTAYRYSDSTKGVLEEDTDFVVNVCDGAYVEIALDGKLNTKGSTLLLKKKDLMAFCNMFISLNAR